MDHALLLFALDNPPVGVGRSEGKNHPRRMYVTLDKPTGRGGGRGKREWRKRKRREKHPCVCVWKEPVPVPNRPCALPLQFEELQVSKFLVSMEASGLPFTLLLNKADLVPEQEVQRRLQQVWGLGYEDLVPEQVWRGQVYEGHTTYPTLSASV